MEMCIRDRLIRGEIDIPLFFMFLLVASRLYAPLEGALQNLAAIISTKTNIEMCIRDSWKSMSATHMGSSLSLISHFIE